MPLDGITGWPVLPQHCGGPKTSPEPALASATALDRCPPTDLRMAGLCRRGLHGHRTERAVGPVADG